MERDNSARTDMKLLWAKQVALDVRASKTRTVEDVDEAANILTDRGYAYRDPLTNKVWVWYDKF